MTGDSALVESNPNQAGRKREAWPFAGRQTRLRAALAVIFWCIASAFIISRSERLHLIIPWIFVTNIILIRSTNNNRRTMARFAACLGLCSLTTVAVLDVVKPDARLPPFERTVWMYGLLSIGIITAWLWKATSFAVWRALRAGPSATLARRMTARVVSLFACAVVFHAYALSFMQTHWPKRYGMRLPSQLHMRYEDVTWHSEDGTRIAGWFVPAYRSMRCAVVCHGVGAYKSDMIEFVHALHEAGYNVLAFDFRGHGHSGGHTVSYGKRESGDIVTAIDFLKRHYPSRARRIVGVGWSMGASSLILAAAGDERIEALHLDAAYARTFDIAKVIARQQPPPFNWTGLLLGTAFGCLESGTNLFTLAPVDALARLTPRPIMLVHGEQDKMIPIEQGRELFAAAPPGSRWHPVKRAGHCQTLSMDSPNYERRMIAFLDEALAVGSAYSSP